jgi:hypothetical protein
MISTQSATATEKTSYRFPFSNMGSSVSLGMLADHLPPRQNSGKNPPNTDAVHGPFCTTRVWDAISAEFDCFVRSQSPLRRHNECNGDVTTVTTSYSFTATSSRDYFRVAGWGDVRVSYLFLEAGLL